MRRAFTLIELLVVIAIIAILAAILFPVFAQAKAAAKSTAALTYTKQVATASHIYAADYDDGTVLTDSDFAAPFWQELLMPYSKNRDIFWDPTKTVAKNDTINGYPWAQVTTLAINDSGYAGTWLTNNGTCAGTRTTYVYGRKLSSMEDISNRIAFIPNTWGGTQVGWYYFRAYQANWVNTATSHNVNTWSWYNQVFDARRTHSGQQIPYAKADSSAGKLRRGDFVSWDEAPGTAEYCAWYETKGVGRWGAFWNSN